VRASRKQRVPLADDKIRRRAHRPEIGVAQHKPTQQKHRQGNRQRQQRQINHRVFIHFHAVQKPRPDPAPCTVRSRRCPFQSGRRASGREEAGKRRRDEDPAQHPDLRETAADRHIPLTQPLVAPVPAQACFPDQRILFRFGWRFRASPELSRICAGPQPADHAPDGAKLQANGFDMFLRSSSASARNRASTSSSSVARLVASNRLAGGNIDSGRRHCIWCHRHDTAAHGAETARFRPFAN
jgi:hypothetical protein